MALTQEQINFLAMHKSRLGKATQQFRPITASPTLTVGYMRALRRIAREVTKLVKKYVLPILKKDENQYVQINTIKDAPIDEDLSLAFERIARQLEKQQEELERYTAEAATKAFTREGVFHRRKWVKEINRLAGVDVNRILNDREVKAQILTRVEQNVQLIKTVQPEYLADVQSKVLQGLDRGDDFFSIERSLKKVESFHRGYRPKLIARDQMSKFTGDLNEIRQRDVGIKRYKWRTSQDKDVRPSHRANDGEIFSWASPPSTGHPGQDINCRCVAEPIFEEWLQEIDNKKSWTPVTAEK